MRYNAYITQIDVWTFKLPINASSYFTLLPTVTKTAPYKTVVSLYNKSVTCCVCFVKQQLPSARYEICGFHDGEDTKSSGLWCHAVLW